MQQLLSLLHLCPSDSNAGSPGGGAGTETQKLDDLQNISEFYMSEPGFKPRLL